MELGQNIQQYKIVILFRSNSDSKNGYPFYFETQKTIRRVFYSTFFFLENPENQEDIKNS